VGDTTSLPAGDGDVDDALVDLLRPLARVLIRQARAESISDAGELDEAA